ncbi:helix-turn-helix domain-containing protein [Scandinavium sp. V105_16]|uniref:Helix-turn-helix domain-containing protein n=1 Tax=Scandinavium lactucae TaxID=3095028 RepID=A0AAJ2VUH4_9ENTR|nr:MULTISPECIES: helix-turn-helix domain-containing protein [unclassified Scandinavium]MDX6020470.1 helix-turn-helix domain-containing protein [Scandinavium sp. V105_16]MDX6031978.1 helix-turn-helix domain-containing protein [Scandinavium sp. V105_12]MDX6039824.1 helix-turn-helix domain-containing protein [Scandinavium sp. V105_6]MDX6051443.1 helix-turn-helix domain-containing protein [Scandinavium sp. V105_1]
MTLLFDSSEKIYSSIDFSLLKEEFLTVGRELTIQAGMTIRPKKNEILVVLSGQMTVSASQNHELILGHTFPFMPIGLLERNYNLPLYYHAENDVAFVQLTEEEFDKIVFSDPQHAELLSQILLYMSTTLIHIYYERNNDSGYATIREMLKRYLFKSEDGTLNDEGIASFILKRTRLSRSYVFQILSGLKAGGYITVKNGKLVSINREIPKRF